MPGKSSPSARSPNDPITKKNDAGAILAVTVTGHFRSATCTYDTCRQAALHRKLPLGENRMDSPQRHERRDFRYPLHLPVLVKIAQRKEMHTRSENISLSGMLLSTSSLIPEGSAVEVSVGVDHLPDTGILMSARGKVIRVNPRDSGDFSVAIKLDGEFSLPLPRTEARTKVRTESPGGSTGSPMSKKPPSPVTPSRQPILRRGMHYGLAWHTET